jgi:hypothetical protein
MPGLDLHTGDSLTREEFHRRYESMPRIPRAELIEKVVYVQSSSEARETEPSTFKLVGWLGMYGSHTFGVEGACNTTLRLDSRNELQPNALVIVRPEYGGQVQIDADDFVAGAPELIADVVSNGAGRMLSAKLRAFRRNQVREYVVWRVLERVVDWFVLDGADYLSLPMDNGIYRSRVFPGLWLDVQALLNGDLRKIFEVVQQGVASEEHQRFVERLEQRAATR